MANAYQSSLIQSLRAASPAGSSNTGLTFYANPANGAALDFSAGPPAGLMFKPPVLKMAATAPRSSGGGGGGGGGGSGIKVVLPDLDIDRGLRKTINPVRVRESAATDTGTGTGDVTVADTVGDAGGGTGGTTINVTGGDKTTNTKTDASYWGEGGENLAADSDNTFGVLLSDMDGAGSLDNTFGVLMSDADDPSGIDDVNGADLASDQYTFGVLESDIDPEIDVGRVDDVNGADLQSDQYNFGVLMDDVNDPGSVDDVNGSDLQSEQYTFGVLASDADPLKELVDINQLIDELDSFDFAKEAEKKLRDKFGRQEFVYE